MTLLAFMGFDGKMKKKEKRKKWKRKEEGEKEGIKHYFSFNLLTLKL